MSRPRCYDHDEARRLYGEGVSVRELSARFGVSEYSIRYAVVPGEADKIRERRQRWTLRRGNTCVDCGKPITAPVGVERRPLKRCASCANIARRLVTDTKMRCVICKQWKPDSEFFHSSGADANARRGHRNQCKACEVARRRERRHRNRRPCINGCGTMVNSPRDNNNRGTGMCLKCVRQQRAKAS